ncbi:unnamed protein product [Ectocarpus fasciculatus]
METPTTIPPATSVPPPAGKLAARGAKKTSIVNWWSAPRAMRSMVRTARTTCLLTKSKRVLNRCQRAGDNGVGAFSSGGGSLMDRISTPTQRLWKLKRRRRSAGKKHYRIPRTSGPRESLMVPKDDQQAKLMLSLYRKAREMERKLAGENKRINEVRNLTLLDLTEAASCLDKGNPVSAEIWRKCE